MICSLDEVKLVKQFLRRLLKTQKTLMKASLIIMPTVPDYYIKERSFSITDICLLTAKALINISILILHEVSTVTIVGR